jgi:hypothetical protein
LLTSQGERNIYMHHWPVLTSHVLGGNMYHWSVLTSHVLGGGEGIRTAALLTSHVLGGREYVPLLC